MNNDITALLEFLDRCGPEVSGHELTRMESKYMAIVERFIAGQCDDTERRELSRFLQLHPAWIRWIAERVKTACQFGDDSALSAE